MDDITTWAEGNYYVPDAARVAGRRVSGPIRLAEHQRRILRHVFTPDAEGRFPYDRVVFSCPKKSGKTSLAALVGLWYAGTQEPPNEIYVVANDMEQAQGRVFKALLWAARRHPQLTESKFSDERITLPNGTVVAAISSDYAGAAGSNHGLVLFDEIWAFIGENLQRLWDELTPVPTRLNSMQFVTTYAGFEGQSEILHNLYLTGVGPDENERGQGERIPELADLPCWRNGRLFVYWDHEHRMPWQTKAYLAQQRATLRPAAYLRLHENRWVTATETFIPPEKWDRCVDQAYSPFVADKTTAVYGMIDASVKRDASAVVFCAYDRTQRKVVLANHKIWIPEKGGEIDLENDLEAYILDARKRLRIGRIRYDPFQMHRSATTLKRLGLPMEEFPQTEPNLTAASQQLFDLIEHNNLVMYPDDELRRQMLSAVAVQKKRGWRIDKTKAAHKIDAIVALAGAAHCAVENGAYDTDRPIVVEMPFSDLAQRRSYGPLEAALPFPLRG